MEKGRVRKGVRLTPPQPRNRLHPRPPGAGRHQAALQLWAPRWEGALCEPVGCRQHGSLSLAFREWEAVCSLSFGGLGPSPHILQGNERRGVLASRGSAPFHLCRGGAPAFRAATVTGTVGSLSPCPSPHHAPPTAASFLSQAGLPLRDFNQPTQIFFQHLPAEHELHGAGVFGVHIHCYIPYLNRARHTVGAQ